MLVRNVIDSFKYSQRLNNNLTRKMRASVGKDNEVSGEGNSYTAEFWQYDSRLGRRFNLDPKPNPSTSEYACFNNNPIFYTDVSARFACTRFLLYNGAIFNCYINT